jgi:tetratricopeptide (TPR) repeat protein
MEILIHSKGRPTRFKPSNWARLLAVTLAVSLLGLSGQVCALEDRDIDALISSYSQALNPNKRQAAFWEAIGEVRNERKAGRPEKALELATKLAAASAKDSDLLSVTESQIGELYVDLNQWAQAKSHFTSALRLEEARPAVEIERFEGPLMWLAGVSIQLGEADVAERHYVRLLEMKQRAKGALNYSAIGQLWALANLALRQGEPPRLSRRLNTLRGLSHEQVEQVFARGA